MKKIIIYLMLVFILAISVSAETVVKNEIVGGDLGEVTIETEIYSGFDKFLNFFRASQFAIYASPSTPEPGENVNIEFGGSIPLDCTPTYGVIKIGASGATFTSVPSSGTSFVSKVNINAPNIEGNFNMRYQIFGQIPSPDIFGKTVTGVCSEDSKPITVQYADTGEQPIDYCGQWQRDISVSNGDYYQRTCYEYSTGEEVIDFQRKIVCDSGYSLKNNECVSDIEQVNEITCYTCSDGVLRSKTFENSCGSGYIEYRINCDSPDIPDEQDPVTDTDVNCYVCENGQQVRRVFVNECPMQYSENQIDCVSDSDGQGEVVKLNWLQNLWQKIKTWFLGLF